MKRILTILLAAASALTLSAQAFRPEIVNGAVLGGLAGAIIGNNSGHGNAGQGAVIGAAAGAILGGIVSEANRDQAWGNPRAAAPHRVYRRASHEGHRRDGDRVVPGLVLGGIAGAVIGNNSGRGNGARGAVIGAIAGGVLGAISDADNRRYSPAPRFRHTGRYYEPVSYVCDEPAAAVPAPQQVTIINNYYLAAGSSTGCNALFGR